LCGPRRPEKLPGVTRMGGTRWMGRPISVSSEMDRIRMGLSDSDHQMWFIWEYKSFVFFKTDLIKD